MDNYTAAAGIIPIQEAGPGLMIYQKFRSAIAALLVLGFIFQLGLQNIPVVSLYHSEDGTICSCGCTELNHSESEQGDECAPTGCVMLCLCDQDHEKRVEFSVTQLRDFFAMDFTTIVHYSKHEYFFSPTLSYIEFGFSSLIDHPPQV